MNVKGSIVRGIIITLFFLNQSTHGQNSKFYFDNFTADNGLSDNYVNCIFQDKKGWVWIGSGMGIERFDGLKFKKYAIHLNDSMNKGDILVRNFFESSKGTLFACTEEFGLAWYNRQKDRFERLKINGRAVLTDVSVKNLAEDQEGNIWAATKKGICKIDFIKQNLHFYQHDKNNENSLNNNYVRELKFDKEQQLWIGTREGLDRFDPEKGVFFHYSKISDLLHDEILELFFDHKNILWVGTGSHGVVIVNSKKGEITGLVTDPSNERSNKVNAIYQDRNYNYWIGTRGGLYVLDKGEHKIQWVSNNILEDNSLVHNSIMNITEDAKGDMWIGTRGGLSYLVKEKQVFTNYKELPDNNHYLNNSELYCIWISKEGEVWMGTETGGVNILDPEKGIFRYLTEDNGLGNNCVKSIHSLGNDKILIGTFQGGLNIYDLNTGKINILKSKDKTGNSTSDNIVWDIAIDKNKVVWLGTASGLERYIPETQSVAHYPEFYDMVNGVTWIGVDQDNDLWLGSEVIKVFRPGQGIVNTFQEKGRGFFVDSKDNNWIMTNDRGIVLYDKYTGPVKVYGENDGIASNMTFCMLEDNSGNLWISTANGLSCFDPVNETFQNYFSFNGLQGNQFHYGAAAKTKNGELLFGGKNGLTMFNPGNIIENNYTPPVYITDFKIFNQSVEIGENNGAILKQSITETKKLEIPFKYNVITFEFASLNYSNSENNRYKYMLVGFDNEWIETSENRSATYTNLDPGEYTFSVIASNDNGHWNEKGDAKTLVILPPFYKTFWFRASVVFLTLLFTFFVFIFIFKRREIAKTYELEKIQALKMHELDAFKLRLFTNISHEIKTPLTLIISPLTKILKYDFPDPEIKESLNLMEKNARQLMKLITQLLDFRKLQDGKLKIELKRGDIVRFCKNIFLSFEDIMKEKGILYKFGSVQNKITTGFDPDKLRNILNNLLSNAVRYNTRGGSITFFISMVMEQDNAFEDKGSSYIKIEIQDTGIGIEEKELPKIFNRFYSKTNHKDINSSGIGLAFTKELVELHKGKIFVESKQGKGSVFTVLLPFVEEEAESIEDIGALENLGSKEYIKTKDFQTAQKSKKILLVVEDNEDVLQFIKTHFKNEFIVLEATNGNDGLDLTLKTIPDIVVSDIMMPGINGKELCGRIKKDERTSHIPVILLTALSSTENVKDGLMKGADDYITKPFDIDILQTKIENLLAMRKSLMEKYSKINLLQPSHVTVKTLDEKFLDKAVKITEKYIADPGLSIETFIEQMGVSRMQLYRKIAALTNMTVKEFVNDIRLKRAEQILSEKQISVSEVAYGVGFNDLSYFGKCFKRKYGMTPSDYNFKHVSAGKTG